MSIRLSLILIESAMLVALALWLMVKLRARALRRAVHRKRVEIRPLVEARIITKGTSNWRGHINLQIDVYCKPIPFSEQIDVHLYRVPVMADFPTEPPTFSFKQAGDSDREILIDRDASIIHVSGRQFAHGLDNRDAAESLAREIESAEE